MNSEATAPSVKLSAFQYVTKCAELEPVKEAEGKGNSGPRISIEIVNFGGTKPTTINVGGQEV
jgi:hypothetical protein